MSGPEDREYFRVDDRLTIEYRSVDPEEFQRLEGIIEHNPSYAGEKSSDMHFLGEAAPDHKGEKRELYAYLMGIEKKLDMILEILGQQRGNPAYKRLSTRVNISGAGLKFVADEPLEQGQRLEVRLALPVAPFPKIPTLCEVVRVEAPNEAGSKEWAVALKFLVMNDFDRDVLINYIFTKEREKARLGKGTG